MILIPNHKFHDWHKILITRNEKMKIIKRIVNIVLSAAISIGCVGAVYTNYESEYSFICLAAGDYLGVETNDDGTLAISKYTGTAETVVIPAAHNGRKITYGKLRHRAPCGRRGPDGRNPHFRHQALYSLRRQPSGCHRRFHGYRWRIYSQSGFSRFFAEYSAGGEA